ncbi:hypothetical protein Ancab_008039 [Ancistrocladus abbreviatus]
MLSSVAMEKDMALVISPQSSGIAHFMSQVGDELYIPLLSLATDPTLSELPYSYFPHLTQSDYLKMYAIANLVAYYGWEEVTAIFVYDDYAHNGISVLAIALAQN